MPRQTDEEKAARKAAKKAAKEQTRLKRQGLDTASSRKECTLCHRPRDLLVRCTIDASGAWHMLCGKCWQVESGGVADGSAGKPHYRYGGLWKNHAAGSGKRKVPAAPGTPGTGHVAELQGVDSCVDEAEDLKASQSSTPTGAALSVPAAATGTQLSAPELAQLLRDDEDSSAEDETQ